MRFRVRHRHPPEWSIRLDILPSHVPPGARAPCGTVRGGSREDDKTPRGFSARSLEKKNLRSGRTEGGLLDCTSIRRGRGWAEPEIRFRIVHVAVDGPNSAPVVAYREQTVEIAQGPQPEALQGAADAPGRRASTELLRRRPADARFRRSVEGVMRP